MSPYPARPCHVRRRQWHPRAQTRGDSPQLCRHLHVNVARRGAYAEKCLARAGASASRPWRRLGQVSKALDVRPTAACPPARAAARGRACVARREDLAAPVQHRGHKNVKEAGGARQHEGKHAGAPANGPQRHLLARDADLLLQHSTRAAGPRARAARRLLGRLGHDRSIHDLRHGCRRASSQRRATPPSGACSGREAGELFVPPLPSAEAAR
mmetsp:Transcript_33862/g.94353  ORF Transcript_33862/g.94353 Transcript_33862/m.94353 type:complete len:213 (+) Transcript_33862:496-1134(+)